MRFSAAAIVAALPVLSSAQENPLEQYTAQFQNFLGQLGAFIPNPATHDPVAAHEARTGAMKLSILTLENWKETLYEPVAPDAKTSEEWWVLVTGRNKTCFGHCGQIEKAFNETAAKFAELPDTPHMALVNCEDQPILCNSWSASAGSLWAFDMLPAPAAIDIYKKRLNLTTTTSEGLVNLQAAGDREGFVLIDSWFHPFNGKVAEFGLSVPVGYGFWAFNLIPNWLFMLFVSFISRSMMSNRAQAQARNVAVPGGAQRAQ